MVCGALRQNLAGAVRLAVRGLTMDEAIMCALESDRGRAFARIHGMADWKMGTGHAEAVARQALRAVMDWPDQPEPTIEAYQAGAAEAGSPLPLPVRA